MHEGSRASTELSREAAISLPSSVAAPEPFIEPPPLAPFAVAQRSVLRSLQRQARSIAQRQAADRQRRLRERWQDTPCWLASLVFHLTLFVTLGLLTPPDKRGDAIHLVLRPVTLSGSHREPIGAPVRQLHDEADRPGAPEVGRQQAQPESAGEPTAPRSEEALQAHAAQLAEKVEALQNFARQLKELAAQAQKSAAEQPAAEVASITPADPGALVQHLATSSSSAEEPAGSDSYVWPDSTAVEAYQPAYDDIVRRFILYDIGQLRGEAGRQARSEFYALGPSAIPALVRGLNRSASIRASCPVGVISSKLRTSVQQNQNPAMLSYALENIGRGVKSTDPHADLVKSLREQLTRQYRAGGRGRAILRTAEALERGGLKDEARRRYQLLVDDHPNTREAMVARRRLQLMRP